MAMLPMEQAETDEKLSTLSDFLSSYTYIGTNSRLNRYGNTVTLGLVTTNQNFTSAGLKVGTLKAEYCPESSLSIPVINSNTDKIALCTISSTGDVTIYPMTAGSAIYIIGATYVLK